MRRLAASIVVALALTGCGGSSEVSREVGARCDDSSECDDRCLLPSDDWPGGFCTLSCDSDADCPDETTPCVDDEGGVCLFLCDEVPDCAFLGGGYTCQTRNSRPSGEGVRVCVPA